jgi:hypothetical protein
VSANRESGPAAYVQNNANVHLHDGTEQIATGKNTPTRPLDTFEAAALADLRNGSNLVVRTAGDAMQMFGAVRAATECRSCHKCETDALLGAFTYHFVLQSEATPDDARLADRGGLSAEVLAAVDVIEGIGGKVSRQPGGPVTGVHLSFSRDQDRTKEPRPDGDRLQITNVSLELLKPLQHLESLEIRDSLVDDRGMKEIVQLKSLRRLILQGNFYITDDGLRELKAMTGLRHLDVRNVRWRNEPIQTALEELKRALPECEVIHDENKP